MGRFEERSVKTGVRLQRKIVEGQPPAVSHSKGVVRKRIDEEVGDIYQLVANLSDSVSLLTSTISAMYNVISATQKAKIPAEERALIEHMITKFQATTTSADIDISSEGTAAVDKLIEPQGKIGEIMMQEKGLV